MKRKLSFLLMSFLAFGTFGVMSSAKASYDKMPTTKLVAAEEVTNIEISQIWNFHGDLMYASVRFQSGFDAQYYFDNGSIYINGNKVDACRADGDAYIMHGFADKGTAEAYLFEFYEGDVLKAKAVLIKSIAAPTGVTIENGKIIFTPSAVAERHSLQYLKGASGDEVVDTLNDVKSGDALRTDLPAGAYRIQVRAHYGDMASEWAQADTLYQIMIENAEQLDAPTNVHVTDGTLTFDSVTNAAYYLVEYMKEGSLFTSEIVEKSPYVLNSSLRAGTYTIRVTAMNGENLDYLPSNPIEAPETFEIEFTAIKLTINEIYDYHGDGFARVRFDAWNNPDFSFSDISYYYVSGVNDIQTHNVASFSDTERVFRIFGNADTPHYEIKFYNSADILIAETVYVRSVVTPTNVMVVDNATVTFTPNSIAEKHSLQYVRTSDSVVVATEDNVVSGHVLKEDLDVGTYRIQIRAHYGEMVSDWATSENNYEIASESAEQLITPTNVKVEEGKLYFDLVNNATHYSVDYYKDGSLAATETAYESPYTLNSGLKAGEYTIRISAMNENPDFIQSEYAEAKEKFVIEYVAFEVKITPRTYYGGNYANLGLEWEGDVSLKDETAYYTVNGQESRFFDWFVGENNRAGNFQIFDDGSQESYEFLFYNKDGMLIARGVLVNKPADTVGQFIADWHEMRKAGGEEGICAFLTDSENATLKALLDRFMAFSPEDQETIRLAADVGTTTIGQTMDYMTSMQSWVNDALGTSSSGLNGILLTDNSDSAASITIVAVLALIAISGYYFVQKKKFAK